MPSKTQIVTAFTVVGVLILAKRFGPSIGLNI